MVVSSSKEGVTSPAVIGEFLRQDLRRADREKVVSIGETFVSMCMLDLLAIPSTSTFASFHSFFSFLHQHQDAGITLSAALYSSCCHLSSANSTAVDMQEMRLFFRPGSSVEIISPQHKITSIVAGPKMAAATRCCCCRCGNVRPTLQEANTSHI